MQVSVKKFFLDKMKQLEAKTIELQHRQPSKKAALILKFASFTSNYKAIATGLGYSINEKHHNTDSLLADKLRDQVVISVTDQ